MKGCDHPYRGLGLLQAGIEAELEAAGSRARPVPSRLWERGWGRAALRAPGSEPLLCSFVNPGSGEALRIAPAFFRGRDDARLVLKRTWPGRGAGSVRERGEAWASSFFFNRGMTQASPSHFLVNRFKPVLTGTAADKCGTSPKSFIGFSALLPPGNAPALASSSLPSALGCSSF